MPSPLIAVRVTPDVHQQVLDRAATSGTTIADVLRVLINEGLTVAATHGNAIPK